MVLWLLENPPRSYLYVNTNGAVKTAERVEIKKRKGKTFLFCSQALFSMHAWVIICMSIHMCVLSLSLIHTISFSFYNSNNLSTEGKKLYILPLGNITEDEKNFF